MANPEGLWFSYITSAPSPFPNDGVVVIKLIGDEIEGYHLRPPFEKTTIKGKFTDETTSTLAHIKFEETYSSVPYEYEADIVSLSSNYYVTTNGKRRKGPAANASTDDWVGTHTT